MRMDNNNYSNKVKRTHLLHHNKNYALTPIPSKKVFNIGLL